MSSTRAQQAQLIKNQTFLDQLAGCLLYAASQVLNEAPSTPNHAARVQFANAILVNPAHQAEFMAPGILTNATIAGEAGSPATIADSDMDYVVASLYDKYASQFAAQISIGAPLQLGM